MDTFTKPSFNWSLYYLYDIIITNTDKGGAIVIMDIDKYISEAQRQLNDKNNYKKLQTDPTLQHS